MEKIKCASFFAGVGGIDLGFEQTGHFETVYANEFDPFPAKTFEKNFNLTVDTNDIKNVNPADIPDFDVLLAGFPCQPFSIAGYQKGFEDGKGRGTLFFELIRIIRQKKPRVVFLENVKNLVGHDNGNTFRVIIEALNKNGYHCKHQVLNAMEYGNIPQNRERIYIVGFRNVNEYGWFDFPDPIKLETKLSDVIDYQNKVDDRYYYDDKKYKDSIYETLVAGMDDPLSIYQWRRKYVRKNKSGVVPTLTANMGEGGHNVPLIKSEYGIRKLTPHECFNVQGFPLDFCLPEGVADSKLYKQAGNSVCVTVIRRIAENIYSSISRNSSDYIDTEWIKEYSKQLSVEDQRIIEDMLKAYLTSCSK